MDLNLLFTLFNSIELHFAFYSRLISRGHRYDYLPSLILDPKIAGNHGDTFSSIVFGLAHEDYLFFPSFLLPRRQFGQTTTRLANLSIHDFRSKNNYEFVWWKYKKLKKNKEILSQVGPCLQPRPPILRIFCKGFTGLDPNRMVWLTSRVRYSC